MNHLASWWGRLPVRGKFLVVAAAGLVAVLVPTWQALQGLNQQRQIADGEVASIPATRTMLTALLEMREARALNALVVGGDSAMIPQRDATLDQTTAALAALETVFADNAKFVKAPAALAEAQQLWSALAADARAGRIETLDQSRQRFTEPALLLDAVLDHVRDESGFSYTPYVDSYHLMLAALWQGPQLQGRLGEARARGLAYLNGGATNDAIRGELISLYRMIEAADADFDRELTKAIAANPALGSTLLEKRLRRKS